MMPTKDNNGSSRKGCLSSAHRTNQRWCLSFVLYQLYSFLLTANAVSDQQTNWKLSGSAEYFYANDKLADSEVAQFVNSLQNQTGVTRPSSSLLTPLHYHQPRPSVFTPSHIRYSQTYPSSATYLNRQSKIELSSSSIINSKSLPPPPPSASSTFSLNRGDSRFPSHKHWNNPLQNSSEKPDTSDLSWLQPVYIANKTTNTLRTDAFKTNITDVELFGANRTNIEQIISIDSSGGNVLSTTTTTGYRWNNMTFTLKDEQWVAPIIALSLLNMMGIGGFECFVIYRACRTCPSRRHLFLGQMLLLGLFLSSAMGITFVPNANWLSCTIIRAGLGVCYTLVYATLLVKTVFLLSLHTGVYLSAEYQALLLFFIISTQVAIDGQWLIHRSSTTVIDYMDGYGHAVYKCDHSVNQLLISLVYVMILIVLVAIMAFRVRGYRENHGEAMFIGITATCTVVLWLVWIAGTLTSTPHYRDGFIAFGVVGNATLTFIIMFLPKGRQLAAVGREGISMDRDQLSTGSSPSIYTPSFLHIKPVSQLIPLSKPISGFGNGNVGVSVSGYHLYKQFQGTGTTVTSPISTNPPVGLPNSYSSHAVYNIQNNHGKRDDEDDPNYSNLSTVFTTSGANDTIRATASNLNSPVSENISTSTSSGGSKCSGSQLSKSSKSKSSNHSKSSNAGHQSNKSSVNDSFFYLKPPPLPPGVGQAKQPSSQQAHQRPMWRQSCYTSNYNVTTGAKHSRSYHYFPKSTTPTGNVGAQPYTSSTNHVYHPPLPPIPTGNSAASTPMTGHPSNNLLSPASDDVAYYFASFDAASNTTRQLLSNNNNNNNSGGNNHQTTNTNFKYFRGSIY